MADQVVASVSGEDAISAGMNVRRIVDRFGGMSSMARALGHPHVTRIQNWIESGSIPPKHHLQILDVAAGLRIRMEREDFVTFPLEHLAFQIPAQSEAEAA